MDFNCTYSCIVLFSPWNINLVPSPTVVLIYDAIWFRSRSHLDNSGKERPSHQLLMLKSDQWYVVLITVELSCVHLWYHFAENFWVPLPSSDCSFSLCSILRLEGFQLLKPVYNTTIIKTKQKKPLLGTTEGYLCPVL
jgi:hypothetical protein